MNQLHHPPPPSGPGYPQHPYAGQPGSAYAYAPTGAPVSRQAGLNPWVAALLGGLVGATVTALLAFVVGVVGMGMPMPWEGPDDWVDDWTGQVDVASDGSVLGFALADAVDEVGGGGYYEEVVCPDTADVAEDTTVLCDVDDGFDRYRVVVVFLDDEGAFETAELLTP